MSLGNHASGCTAGIQGGREREAAGIIIHCSVLPEANAILPQKMIVLETMLSAQVTDMNKAGDNSLAFLKNKEKERQ